MLIQTTSLTQVASNSGIVEESISNFWFPISIAIISFIGITLYNRFKEHRRIIDVWNFIKIWIEQSLPLAEKSLNHFQRCVTLFDAKKLTPMLNIQENIDFGRIVNMEHDELYKILISSRKNKSENDNLIFFNFLHSLKLVQSDLDSNADLVMDISGIVQRHAINIRKQRINIKRLDLQLLERGYTSEEKEILKEYIGIKSENNKDLVWTDLHDLGKNKLAFLNKNAYKYKWLANVRDEWEIYLDDYKTFFIQIKDKVTAIKANNRKIEKSIKDVKTNLHFYKKLEFKSMFQSFES